MISTILEIGLGALIAIAFTIIIENLRKPKLYIKLAAPIDNNYINRPAQNVRFLGVEVINNNLPKFARWMLRNSAIYCHAEITFHHLDGQDIFGRIMEGRWSGSPEPASIHFKVGDNVFSISDPFKLISRIDIPPGESQRLDIAAKFENETECYGWNNESYFSNPIWRNPNWKMFRGRYLVRVKIISSGQIVNETFRLINDVERGDFRLEKRLPNDNIHE